MAYALAGGDDYELCFTLSPLHYAQLLEQQPDINIQELVQLRKSDLVPTIPRG